MKKIIVFIAIMSFIGVIPISAQSTSNFQLINKTVIGGEGGWDYLSVDSKERRLYVSHTNQVEVLDLDKNVKVGTITGTQGVHGIVIVPNTGRGVVTNGRSQTATIFDIKTLEHLAELPTGRNPDALLYDSYSGNVFVFNHSGGSVTVIDVKAAKVLGTIEVGGTLEAGASDGNGTIFVNVEDKSEVVSFDAKSFAIKNRWSLAPGEEPSGLAIDPKTHRLFSACHNSLMIVMDSNSGKIVAQVPIGQGVDGAVFDPVSKCAISSNGEGSITVVKEISPTEFAVEETVKTESGARTITYDEKTHHIFLSTAQYEAPTGNQTGRRPVLPNTFMVLEYGRD